MIYIGSVVGSLQSAKSNWITMSSSFDFDETKARMSSSSGVLGSSPMATQLMRFNTKALSVLSIFQGIPGVATLTRIC